MKVVVLVLALVFIVATALPLIREPYWWVRMFDFPRVQLAFGGIVTLGLFILVLNGLMFWMASGILGGFHVTGFWAAMLGALIYSVLGLLIDRLVAQLFPE